MLTEQEKSLLDRQLMRIVDWKNQHEERLINIQLINNVELILDGDY